MVLSDKLLPLPNSTWINYLKYIKTNEIYIDSNNINCYYIKYKDNLPIETKIKNDVDIIKEKVLIKKEWNKFEDISNKNKIYIENRFKKIIKIQKTYRKYRIFKLYLKIKQSLIKIQCFFRVYNSKKIYSKKNKERIEFLKKQKINKKKMKNLKKKRRKKIKKMKQKMKQTIEDDLLNSYSNESSDIIKIYNISKIICEQATNTKLYQDRRALKYLKKFKKKNNIITFDKDITPRTVSYSIVKFIKLYPYFNKLLFYYMKDNVIGIYIISVKRNDIYIISYAKMKVIKEAMDIYIKNFKEEQNRYYMNHYSSLSNLHYVNSKLNTNMFSPQSSGNFNFDNGVV